MFSWDIVPKIIIFYHYQMYLFYDLLLFLLFFLILPICRFMDLLHLLYYHHHHLNLFRILFIFIIFHLCFHHNIWLLATLPQLYQEMFSTFMIYSLPYWIYTYILPSHQISSHQGYSAILGWDANISFFLDVSTSLKASHFYHSILFI